MCKRGRAMGIFGQFIAAASFLDPTLLEIGQETLTRWLKEEPKLAIFEHYIENLFRKQEHVRSAELVMGYADPAAVAANRTGVMNTLFIGEAWANFGWLGFYLSPIVVGFVVFLILTLVQFIVITKGSERVAEVGARFTLDAMPGKQMAIDMELRANTITPEQAREQRAMLAQESQFFGAMDGEGISTSGRRPLPALTRTEPPLLSNHLRV